MQILSTHNYWLIIAANANGFQLVSKMAIALPPVAYLNAQLRRGSERAKQGSEAPVENSIK